MESIFKDKNKMPGDDDLNQALGETSELWFDLKKYVYQKYPKAKDLWSYSKAGWSYRINDKKRAVIYLLPRDQFFKAAFVFGQKATDKILESNISEDIKNALREAKVYAEGRGIRIDVKNNEIIKDIRELIDIKLEF